MTGPALAWELARPPGWIRVTDDPVADLDGIDVPESGRERLESELDRLRAQARAEGAPGRRRWAFVPVAPTGAVPAVMTTELVRRGAMSMQDLATALQDGASAPESRLWHRDVAVKRLANGTAVTGLELVRATSDDGEEHLIERYEGTLATPTPGIALRLVITTYDLALFADIVSYGDEVLGGITFEARVRV